MRRPWPLIVPTARAARTLAIAVVAVAALAGPAGGQPARSPGTVSGAVAQDDPSPHSDARLVADVSSVAPGDAFDVALVISVEPGWHIYWANPGDSGQPVTAEWAVDGGTAAALRFPVPSRYDEAGLTTYAHSGTPAFLARVATERGATGPVQIEADARWLICSDVCLVARQAVSLAVPTGETVRTGALDAARAALPDAPDGWTASAAADDGGYLLTVQPPPGVDLDGALFFVDRAGVLDHGAAQSFRREGGAWAVRLEPSDYATGTADRLSGVLSAGDVAVALDVPVATDDPPVAASLGAGASAPGLGLWSALLFALVGGVVLNLMPCVFPILGIKVLGFVGGRDDTPAQLRAHGLAFGAGVVVSFLALAGGLLALRAAGASLGWGFQLQSPPVVAGLAVLMVGLALNLLGVFSIGERVAAAGGRLDRGEGLGGAFLSGVLATVVATPCTAPFMGAALGYAVAQPAALALTVFATLGVGMALPYVVLSFRPALVRRLPRPGPWMETLRQGLAFPLLATAVWLVWVFGLQTGIDAAAGLLLALVLLGLAAWTWGHWPRYHSRRARTTARAFAVAVAAGAVSLVVVASSLDTPAGGGALGDAGLTPTGASAGAEWQAWDADRVRSMTAGGTPVFVDFTAAWCLTCQVNKRTVLTRPAVRDAFAARGVATMRADWTTEDPAITEALASFGRSGVPLYVLYPGGDADPVLLPEVLTTGIVLDALDRLPDAAAPATVASRD